MLAITVGDIRKARPATKQFLEPARKWEGTLEGQAVAAEVEELLNLLDDRLCATHGEVWSLLIGVPNEALPNPWLLLSVKLDTRWPSLVYEERLDLRKEIVDSC
jgi:hypothetical protein